MGIFLLDHGTPDQAINYFEQFKAMLPKQELAYEDLGRAYLAKKDCNQAEASFQKMLSFNPADSVALSFLRKTYLECFRDPQKAQEFENSCLKIEQQKTTKLKDL